ncbi:MAG: hypothetical protein Hyperionvirus10_7 [Hyperionvirus sp.]|uniref:Sel1 repeat family protein n=1 Tax=Hyperionvirus sp. TaxID=2487770 RepID=A0A3G5ABJ6_9VIRU|nr:MAG: hypothetical protein Hyperionvirus10_7 [Hyperionvirus sp.]
MSAPNPNDLVQAKKGDVNAMMKLGGFYNEQKDKIGAILWYTKAYELKNGSAAAYLGLIYRDIHQVVAEEWFRKAIELEYYRAYSYLGQMYEDKETYHGELSAKDKRALAIYEEGTKHVWRNIRGSLNTVFTFGYNEIIALYIRTKNYSKAEETFERLKATGDLSINICSTRKQLADMYCEIGQGRKALEMHIRNNWPMEDGVTKIYKKYPNEAAMWHVEILNILLEESEKVNTDLKVKLKESENIIADLQLKVSHPLITAETFEDYVSVG